MSRFRREVPLRSLVHANMVSGVEEETVRRVGIYLDVVSPYSYLAFRRTQETRE